MTDNYVAARKAVATSDTPVTGVDPVKVIIATGPQGAKGDKGDPGDLGSKGDQGLSAYELAVDAGFVGDMNAWLDSLVGADGQLGPTGKSAYQSAVDNGFTGDVVTWLASLHGAAGEAGPQGVQGIQGVVGPKGDKGDTGDTGAQGPRGIQGPPGVAGINFRETWDNIIDYAQGDAVFYNGSSWYASGNPPLGEIPSNASSYWWPLSIQGAQGPQGVQGATGSKGDKGDTGAVGPQGAQGIQGAKGDTGAQGIQGVQGDPGPKGDPGIQGDPGTPGTPGTNGTDGRGINTIARTSGDGSAGSVDVYTITFSDSTTSAFTVRNGTNGTSSARARASAAVTTASLASNATDNVSVGFALAYRLYSVTVDRPCRIRIYATDSARTADASRQPGTDPTVEGVILDYVATAAGTHLLSPLVDGASMESTPTTAISMAVTNMSGASSTVTVGLVGIATEG